MKEALLAGLVLVTTACGAYQFPGGSAAAMGTVTGTVTVVPCGPVEPMQPDSAPCRMRPATGVEVDFAWGGKVVAAQTGADGRYAIELAEGTYQVSVKNHMRIVKGPREVSVKAGSTVNADYVVDSGIRLPAPQQ
jgi:hypothetical protein